MIHFAYPSLSKGLLAVGSMVRFPAFRQAAIPVPSPVAANFYPHTILEMSTYTIN